ncbi:MAG: type II and III secretion system protein family protein [Deltaproteobacteria bacterium]|nr:MAG: type II and III secretion system protein family protein [Deltaproteobacteria bacterium]
MVKVNNLEWQDTVRLLGGFLLGIAFCLWTGGGPVQASDLLERVKDQEIKQVLRLRLGSSKVIKTPFPVTRVSVGNPEIADIVVISDREIYVNALGPGVTNLTLWGKKRFTSTMVTVEIDVTILKEKLAKILPKEKIGVEAAGGSIILSGEVSSPVAQQTALELAAGFLRAHGAFTEKEEAKGALPAAIPSGGMSAKGTAEGAPKEIKIINLMHVGGIQQVMVEVRVAEIQRDLGRNIGINFFGTDRQGNFALTMLDRLTTLNSFNRGFNTTTVEQAVSSAINAMAGFKTGSWLWTVFFNVAKNQGLARILAEPNLVATSGQEAKFLAGGEFPVPVPQPGAGGSVITIEYKPFGVGLVFTPTVLDEGKIALKVSPEVSELDFVTAPVTIAGTQVPGLRKRTVTTHIELKDGQSFAIAGLLSDNHRNTIAKYPLLGDIPVLGTLFRSARYQKNETELVVLVTPRLVKPLTTTAIKLPTDKYIEPNDFEAYLLGALEGRKKKSTANNNNNSTPPPMLPEGFGQKSLY